MGDGGWWMLSCYMLGLFVHSVFRKTDPAWPEALDPFSLFKVTYGGVACNYVTDTIFRNGKV